MGRGLSSTLSPEDGSHSKHTTLSIARNIGRLGNSNVNVGVRRRSDYMLHDEGDGSPLQEKQVRLALCKL